METLSLWYGEDMYHWHGLTPHRLSGPMCRGGEGGGEEEGWRIMRKGRSGKEGR